MDFFEAVLARRSIRKYKSTPVPAVVMDKALDAALLAPNSSNMQTWRIYWVNSSDIKKKMAEACLNQGAARTAQELVVFVADPSLWKISQQAVLKNFGDTPHKTVLIYYTKLMPFLYSWRFLAPIKWLAFNVAGLFKAVPRKPWSSRDIEEIAIKSTALAAENFMLAISAQGFDTCPMEGFDESRVKNLLGLGWRARIVMVVSVGERDPEGLWGERFRLPKDIVVKKI
ncbi:NADH dehydrogenase [compost metagenome]